MWIFSTLVTKLSLVFFAAPGDACKPVVHTFFIFQSWWKYLDGKRDVLNNCVPNIDFLHTPSDLWLVGLAILDILLRLAGFLAVVSIIIAGIELVRTEGSTEKATNARQRIINSLLGLALAAGATALVAFVGNVVHPHAGSGLPQTVADDNALSNVLNAVFVIVGALAVLFIVLAGFRMVTAGDNPTKVAESRRQIIFAALGLVVVAAAASIVNFVLGRIK
jgi:type IV secretory pathway VirB2 component (pilin)